MSKYEKIQLLLDLGCTPSDLSPMSKDPRLRSLDPSVAFKYLIHYLSRQRSEQGDKNKAARFRLSIARYRQCQTYARQWLAENGYGALYVNGELFCRVHEGGATKEINKRQLLSHDYLH